MKKTRNILAISAIAILIFFLVYTVIIVAIPKDIILQGQVEATQVKVASKLIGRIDSLCIKKGDSVEKGQLLFVLGSPEIEAKLEQAMAGKQAALAQSNKAQNGAQIEDIQAAFHAKPDLLNLLLDRNLSDKIKENLKDLRKIVCQASNLGIPIPGIMSSLGYIDSYRSSWLPANLIQAQRDYFGAHTYERIDAKGTYHTDWQKGL